MLCLLSHELRSFSRSCDGTNVTLMGKEIITTEILKILLDMPQFFELADVVKSQIRDVDPNIIQIK
jgi:hypothetical protein